MLLSKALLLLEEALSSFLFEKMSFISSCSRYVASSLPNFFFQLNVYFSHMLIARRFVDQYFAWINRENHSFLLCESSPFNNHTRCYRLNLFSGSDLFTLIYFFFSLFEVLVNSFVQSQLICVPSISHYCVFYINLHSHLMYLFLPNHC